MVHLCTQTFKEKGNFTQHIEQQHNVKTEQQEQDCDVINEDLKSELKTEIGMFKCNVCMQAFKEIGSLTLHIKQKHNGETELKEDGSNEDEIKAELSEDKFVSLSYQQ